MVFVSQVFTCFRSYSSPVGFVTLYADIFVYLEQQKRFRALMAAAVFEGASVGPLIDLAIQFDPRYLLINYLSV